MSIYGWVVCIIHLGFFFFFVPPINSRWGLKAKLHVHRHRYGYDTGTRIHHFLKNYGTTCLGIQKLINQLNFIFRYILNFFVDIIMFILSFKSKYQQKMLEKIFKIKIDIQCNCNTVKLISSLSQYFFTFSHFFFIQLLRLKIFFLQL